MEVEFELTEDDLVAFNRCHRAVTSRRAREEGRRNPVTGWIIVGIGVAIGTVAALTDSLWPVLKDLGLILLGVVLTVLWALALSRPTKLVRKMLNQSRNVRQLHRRTVTTSPDGLRVVGRDFTNSYAWSGIDWIEATPDHAFFFLNTLQAIIVPRAAFVSEEEFKVFVEEVRRWHESAALQQMAGFRSNPASEQIEKE